MHKTATECGFEPAKTVLMDLGNTRLKWARADRLADMQAIAHSENADCWEALTTEQVPERVYLASVAGGARTEALQTWIDRRWGCSVLRARALPQLGAVRSGYRFPERLGIDRFLALLAAWVHNPYRPTVIALAGTALTVDVLDAQGQHLGGLIAPGAELMKSALYRDTAELRPRGRGAVAALAQDTDDAIASGSVRAVGALICQVWADYPNAQLLLSGGAAELVAPWVIRPAPAAQQFSQGAARKIVPALVLEGLAAFAQHHSTHDG